MNGNTTDMKRIAIYLFFDKDGVVDDYVTYGLKRLREDVDTIYVVSNGPIEAAGKAALEEIVDGVWLRENVGFDVWAYKDALDRVGWDKLADYDELILMNYTFFGPIGSFSPMFADMATRNVDFWGITEHREYSPNPFTGIGTMPRHIQSHWIAVKQPLLSHSDFRAYWDTMPPITSYNDSVMMHETRFTKHFSDLGYSFAVAFPETDYPAAHPIFENAELLLRDGCPIVKRRTFFHDPHYLDRHAILGGELVKIAAERGYPVDLLWANLARTTPSRVLQANTGDMSVFAANGIGRQIESTRRILAVAHIYYAEMAGELFTALKRLPGTVDILVTTADEERRKQILAAAEDEGAANVEVRVVESNRGRDVGAFLVTCADRLRDEQYDLVVKVHSKKSAQDEYMVGKFFKEHLIENLLPSDSYAQQLVGLFEDDPSIGMVFPPVLHTGYPTMGHGWFVNRDGVADLLDRLGLKVPLDKGTPLAPLGSMFVCRREVLEPLLQLELGWNDFPDSADYRDGTLAHIIERSYGYLSAAKGMRSHTVMSAERIARDYTMLEYKYQELTQRLPSWPDEQVRALEEGSAVPPVLAVVKRRVQARWPGTTHRVAPLYGLLRAAFHKARRSAGGVARRAKRQLRK